MTMQIPIFIRSNSSTVYKFALIDDVFAPFVARYRWLLFSPLRAPYFNVAVPAAPNPNVLIKDVKYPPKYTPIFLNRLIFFLSQTQPEHWDYYYDNPLLLVDKIRQLQRIKFNDYDVFNCTLTNIDGTMGIRAQRKRDVVLGLNQLPKQEITPYNDVDSNAGTNQLTHSSRSEATCNNSHVSFNPRSIPTVNNSKEIIDDAPHIPPSIRSANAVNNVLNVLSAKDTDTSKVVTRKEMGLINKNKDE